MRLGHVLQRVYCDPWMIRPSVHVLITEIVRSHVSGTAHAADGAATDGTFADAPEFDVRDGVAIIPVRGIVGKGVSALETTSGICDVDDVSALLDMADSDPAIEAKVLAFDTPGGTVTGVPELGAQIRRSAGVKPVVAFTDSEAASAGYWLASQADAVYATQSANVGSIGVYLALLDSNRAHELAGLRVEMISAGKHKGAGYPGTSLSDEQRAELQGRVTYLHDEFKASVRAARGAIPDAAMEGQCFIGPQAVAAGLVDSIVDGIGAAVTDAKKLAAIRRK
jgi:signal peptide peptidase SppA